VNLAYSSGDMSASMLEWNHETCKLRLKETVSVHMYISTAPCGDAAAFPIELVKLSSEFSLHPTMPLAVER